MAFSDIWRKYAENCSHPEGRAGWAVLAAMDILHRPFASWVLSQMPSVSSFLDIGCGSGYMAGRILKRFPGSHASLLDPSPLSLCFAERRLRRLSDRTRFFQGKAESLPFPPFSFDAVIMLDAIYYAALPEAFMEVRRALIPSGCLILGFQARTPEAAPPWFRNAGRVRSMEEIISSLEESGFVVRSVRHGERAWCCIVAEKPMC